MINTVYAKFICIRDVHIKFVYIFNILGIQLWEILLYDGFHDKIHGQVLQCTQIYFVHPINKNNIYITIDYKQLLKLFNQL